MTGTAPRNPYDSDAPVRRTSAPGRRSSRPLPATAFIVHALLVGLTVTAGMLYLMYTTWTWMQDAAPGDNRTIGGYVGLFLCLVGLMFGVAVLSGGVGSLRNADFGPPLAHFAAQPLLGLSILALARGLLFMWEPSSPDWRLQMSGFGAAAVVLGIGTVLYRAPSTREYFGIEQPTRGSRDARVASPRPARPVVTTAPSAGARTKKTLQVLTWVSLAAAVWGGATWWNHSDGIPKCGDKVMTAGDVCNTIGSRGGSSSTYEEALQDKKNTVLIGKWIVAGGAAVFVLSTGGRLALSRRRNAD
ncbi:hypothetical protein [Streptomyces parvus]|uniref:hypothetical protein n=1 Tax=Streptomyces parvus TaxID=66428 RepID=UPI00363EDFD7